MNILEEAKKQGLDCFDDKGCLMLRVPLNEYLDIPKFKKISKNFRFFLKEQNYVGSYGYRTYNTENSNN